MHSVALRLKRARSARAAACWQSSSDPDPCSHKEILKQNIQCAGLTESEESRTHLTSVTF